MARKSNSTDLTVVEGGNLPAKVNPIAEFKSFTRFVKLCDAMVDQLKRIEMLTCEICPGRGSFVPSREEFRLSDEAERTMADAQAMWRHFNPKDAYNENGELKASRISGRLARTVGSVRVTAGEAQTFNETLTVHVAGIEGLEWPALDSACRELEAEAKFLSVAEVLEAIKSHMNLWKRRYSAVWHIDSRIGIALAELEELEHDEKVKAVERAMRAAGVAYETANNAVEKALHQVCQMQEEAARKAFQIQIGLDRIVDLRQEAAEKWQAYDASIKAKHQLFMELDAANANEEDDA